jgi:gamma-glutamyl-gamma-aminobutyrate hydrolase PuuD
VPRPPLIGITTGRDSQRREFYSIRHDYVRSIELAEGIPVVLVPGDTAGLPGLLDRLDGLVLTGGVDVAPELYGETPHPSVSAVNAERDLFETTILRNALARDLPVLGICRGLQLLNVVRGGSLIQDIPSETASAISHDPPGQARDAIAHSVEIVPGTVLSGLLGAGSLEVNSFHHQAAARLGSGLTVSARSEDGIVEGIEISGARFVLAVQWHPESFWKELERFGELFRGLVREASGA